MNNLLIEFLLVYYELLDKKNNPQLVKLPQDSLKSKRKTVVSKNFTKKWFKANYAVIIVEYASALTEWKPELYNADEFYRMHLMKNSTTFNPQVYTKINAIYSEFGNETEMVKLDI